MSTTTTIRLSDELKTRVAHAAKRTGTTAHNYIVEAIAEKTEQHERRGDFHNTADQRYAEIVASGRTISWDTMRVYLQKRMVGKKARPPATRKLIR